MIEERRNEQASVLLFAAMLDFAIGDPRWLPHPVRLMGAGIMRGERCLRQYINTPRGEFIGGAALTCAIVAGSYAAAWSLIQLARRIDDRGGWLTEAILAWTTLAMRDLNSAARLVLDQLAAGDTGGAREKLRLIVGRDTANLNESEIARAVIETVAEGTCDGVFAPLVYLALGGVPLAFAYKAVNTLDSMIGHREPPYTYFGRFAARLDDAANYVPARLTAAGIIAVAAVAAEADAPQAWRVWRRDADWHASPNAGQSEAAMAGALRVRLGGVNFYDGTPHHGAEFGAEHELPTPHDARRALRIAFATSLLGCGAAVLFRRWRESRHPAKRAENK